MPFTNEQVDALKAKLSAAHVKSRSQAGRQLSYIEGWHAIAEANRIFGFHAWDRTLSALKELGAPREVDGKWRVAWMATVRITVATEDGKTVVRDGTGYGSGIDKDLGQAHESAIKEAETDAMKRALMTFGNPFGLALYDKTQEDVEREPPKAAPKPTPAPPPQASAPPDWWGRDNLEIPVARGDYGAWSERIKKAIDAAPDLTKLNRLMSDNGAHFVGYERDEKAGASFLKDRAAKRRAVFAQGEVRDA